MIAYPWGALVTGLMLITAGILTLVRHYLLEPGSTHYPKAPIFLRHVMFGFASCILFVGLQFVWTFMSDKANTMPPQPTPAMQLLATALLVYKSSLLVNILRQRYPEQVWQKLNRINDHLHCRDGKFASWLSRSN